MNDSNNNFSNFTKGNLVSTAYRTRSTDNWSYKYYRYDERGRVIRIWNTIYGQAGKNIIYEYNSQDQVTHINYGDEPEYKRFSYYYDYAGRLGTLNYANADPSIDIDKSDKSAPDINFSSYTYNPNSLLDFQFFNSSRLQNQYRYNSRNWITEINSAEGVFGFTNTYFNNGNLHNQLLYGTYKDFMKNKYNLNYTYSYDNSNRLLTAVNSNQGDNTYSTYNTYDKDGNILTLRRYGDNNTLKDDFKYQYYPNTNKIRLVTGAVDQFRFDLNGNTILDDISGNYDIKYDYRNLITELYHKDPASVTRPNTYATRYFYDESGNRVRKLVYINSQVDPPPVTDWSNPGIGWVLLNNEFYVKGVDGKDLAIYKDNILDEWFVWGNDLVGKIKGDKQYYFYKDHLGSIRAVVDNTGAIVAGYDYDAWGYPLENRSYNGDSIKYKYTGKELDKESFYDYFGARYYDSRIANWTSVDPLLEKHYDFSPYNYVLRNPMRLVDPNGKQEESIYGDPMYYINNETQNFQKTFNKANKEITKISKNIEPAVGILLNYGRKIVTGRVTKINIPLISLANPGAFTVSVLIVTIWNSTPIKTSDAEDILLKIEKDKQGEELEKIKLKNESESSKEIEKAAAIIMEKAYKLKPLDF